ncbi:RNA recognition motif domain, eukaryote, Nucleotide-binding alpha-beta plait domain protein [Artemisia annua]|uniref:RNA recognition motif domain, eukaryote, Nucleotide-binding alpha-beta plait domain protein n=1 Tax=Artemisia annua TaxID=35608 RepID=A0A2U1KN77_ARTAN|nr:RNA recognition motif domain, eukaryote, Nucleotide-binding alpha-beta plait domain protein [Artemisia annua]
MEISMETLENSSEYGKDMSVVIVDDAEGKSRGFGFINFESHEEAKKAKETLNDAEIGCKKWFIGMAMKKSERDAVLKRVHQKQTPDFSNLLVRHLATFVNENDLREVFGAFGCVTSAKVICDDNCISKEESDRHLQTLASSQYLFPTMAYYQNQLRKKVWYQSYRSHWKRKLS